MNKTPRVIEHVVNNDLCVGCGLCTAICPKSLKMKLNQNGFYIPLPEISCDNSSECITYALQTLSSPVTKMILV